MDETDTAHETASRGRSGDGCGHEPGDTRGRQKPEEAGTQSPRRAYPPMPGSRRGRASPLCQATQFVGAGVSPGKLVHRGGHGSAAAGELEAGLRSGCLGPKTARTRGPHSYRAQSRC